jgi:flagellin
MVSSVHTNKGAMVALQNLAMSNRQLETTQDRISTGYRVGGAKDNAAVYAVAQNMRGDVAALSVVKTSLDRAASIADVAIAAGETISDLLIEMREKAVAALDPSIDQDARSAYQADFDALRQQITQIVSNAEFDNANLLDNSLSPGIEFLTDADAADTLTLQTENFSLGGSNLVFTATTSLGGGTVAPSAAAAAASAALSTIAESLINVNAALARLGSVAKQIESHSTFITKLQDKIEAGVGDLVDADLGKESARLQSLQVKQQLGVQALSIANQGPQTILSLFRG